MAAKLYVILGSHACRTGMLLLDHKGIGYDVVEIPTGLHPMAMRALGFGRPERTRELGDRKGRMLGMLDRLGTVPALNLDGDKVETNRDIARHLERVRPDPPLYPAGAGARRAVEEAEAWGDDVFQMVARRLAVAAGTRGALHRGADDGRLGPLLWRSGRMRSAGVGVVGAIFGADESGAAALRAQLPGMLDRIDGWVEAGVLNGEALNVADYMLVSSLALLTYVDDLRDDLARRPSMALIDRVLPEPV